MSPTGREPDLGERLLFQEAFAVAERAYAPYSGFRVGAVAVGRSGRSHHGVNVENASYPVGVCAERAALAAMVVFGERRARYVAVAAADGDDLLPCGMCLQALAEFGAPEVIARLEGGVRVLALAELLPAPFAGPADEGGAGVGGTGAHEVGADGAGAGEATGRGRAGPDG
ncbi:MAG TPA: cytidine deaminase [Thermoleophilia bacterium]|nr:cytidine deaminase [Thermoleophilia bacterium]